MYKTTHPQNFVQEKKGEKRSFLFYSFLYQDFFFPCPLKFSCMNTHLCPRRQAF